MKSDDPCFGVSWVRAIKLKQLRQIIDSANNDVLIEFDMVGVLSLGIRDVTMRLNGQRPWNIWVTAWIALFGFQMKVRQIC